jgi:two-component system, cell cycle sensor histidine kinase and response regulator CckA
MVAPDRGKARGLAAIRSGQASRDTGAGPGESGTRPATTRPRRVLLVEDEDMVRKVVSRMLTSRGYEVHAAASGTEAMALFDGAESQDFDLLVTDLMMPDGGGLGVARNLTARIPGLRVLLVSGYSPTGTEGWDPARFRFLTKPFGAAELSRAIDELFLSHPAG